ncbi:pyrroline-5-carboxylate reductase [Geoalkalibacter ferrihydriticus]|uniref:Pyrroline-5-carboxylate reductase n=2 Tax=Geoalkalibacter ferrihydriticus TaxID=392333 RepID=A0A0C2DWN8_9BACT|nr:pyrroline-5-carboxylate reductase [Geoalkalibacter ferrihydriticus]KIH77874.1 pyrroline-5-carboxylate reductase [Geoalkalibacter ferrihydriticus DSM 17813]SDL83757.1 pyrroline-5-carboxylate reductase [Geoalkalibacter ferrihydriticus]
MQPDRIGFIGGGNMAEALLKGLTAGTFPAERILVAEPRESQRRALEKKYGVRVSDDNLEVARTCDVLILAVKPQLLDEVLPPLAMAVGSKTLLLSILAGVTTAALEACFDGSPRVVRAMPNTPALVGIGAAALCAGRYATPDDLLLSERLLECVGMVRVVSEKEMDAVTGLSGSGPAYVYTFIEALADAGVEQGLSREAALALAAQTVHGAARMVLETGEHPAQLRDRVCSPGGTTIAGVAALEEGGLRAALFDAVRRATRRSRELGGG